MNATVRTDALAALTGAQPESHAPADGAAFNNALGRALGAPAGPAASPADAAAAQHTAELRALLARAAGSVRTAQRARTNMTAGTDAMPATDGESAAPASTIAPAATGKGTVTDTETQTAPATVTAPETWTATEPDTETKPEAETGTASGAGAQIDSSAIGDAAAQATRGAAGAPVDPLGRRADASSQESPDDDAAPRAVTAAHTASSTDLAERTRSAVARDPRPTAVTRDIDALAPEFRTRFERVVTRMRELGYEVRVLETQRTQERQDQLFAQGREAPGPVVTWTRNSNHRTGRAADLQVSGGDGDGYDALAAVAREAGLRTLGAKDPGHVELPRGSAPAEPRAASAARAPAPSAGAPTVHGVATAAPVAPVARVANVAAVASVAVPGVSAPVAVAPAGAHTVPLSSTAPSKSDAQRVAQTSAHRTSPDTDDEGARAERSEPARSDGNDLAQFGGAEQMVSGDRGVAPARTVSGSDMSARIARVLQLQDAANAQTASHVSLQVDDAAGNVARIHVGMRGGELSTRIDVADPMSALRLDSQLGELREILRRQGLEPASLHVRTIDVDGETRAALRVAEAMTSSAVGLDGGAKARDSAHQGGQQERSPAHARQQQDSERQRQRRESQKESK